MTKEILLIKRYGKLVEQITAENEVLRELLRDKQNKYILMYNSRERYKTMYESLNNKVRRLCDNN